MTAPLRVLCLDIEGGFGGSSRSLYYMLKYVNRERIAPSVWCRRAGPIQARYQDIGVPCFVMPEMPKASALPRTSRNIAQLSHHVLEFARNRRALDELATEARRHDLIHFNHEGLAALAYWLKRRSAKPQTIHIRTNVQPSQFARLQMRTISRSVEAAAFITANEERTFRSLGGTAPGRVIYNVVEPDAEAEPHPSVPGDSRLKIASLSNAAYIRGTDRLLDIAAALAARNERNVLFVIAGNMSLTGSWPGALNDFVRRGATLEVVAAELGLSSYFHFLGHVHDPERVLAACDLLIKPTREDNPWGRDILEALAAGRPVLSVGRDQTFVENGVTGVLQPEFDAAVLAATIAALAKDRAGVARLGQQAKARVDKLCNGSDRAGDLADLWFGAAGRS